ncbi:hypothetical protein KO566_02825 [Flavobacteriaceae bacterium XHP0103]|uniref:hypothetical protein n=1 Tax=Marixanthotalea marina TaxID=2844359 RepID=UPI002989A935|nr:hypothetical protein [Marixanthotalea marina]MBU3820981.1 hypothetical protein [Marixanthotalea marina]
MSSPIIVFESAWKDTIPKDLLANVKLSRLWALMLKEDKASLTEALVYMMPRTYEAPLPYEWVNIYTWLGLQYAMQYKNKEQVEVLSDIAPKELSDYETGLLENLRKWIYRQRRKALKARLKDLEKPKTDKPSINQKTLF